MISFSSVPIIFEEYYILCFYFSDEYWLSIGVFVFSALSILFLYLAVDVTRERKQFNQHILNYSDFVGRHV